MEYRGIKIARYRRKIKTNDANLQNDDPESPDSPSKEDGEGEQREKRQGAVHRSGGKRSLSKKEERDLSLGEEEER